MCQQINGLITAQTQARIARRCGKSLTRLGESWRRTFTAFGLKPKERSEDA
jgi:hypothetical protein